MPEPFLTTIAWKVGFPLLSYIAKQGLKRISQTPFFLTALTATVEQFPEFENIHTGLGAFCDSDAFLTLLEQLKSGERELTDDKLVSSFVKATGFYNGQTTHQSASQILLFFFHQLELALYKSSDGLPTIAARQEVLHIQTEQAIHQSSEALSSQLASFQTTVLARLPADECVRSENAQERIWESEIDTARNLMNQGKPKTAHLILSGIRSRLSDSVPLIILVRLAINVGVCALHEDDLDTAEKEFEFALRLQPDSPKALANRAQVELLRGKPDAALDLAQRARIQMPNDSYSTVLCLLSLHSLRKSAEIEVLLREQPWILEDSQCCLALAENACKSSNFKEAQRLLENCMRREPNNPQVWELVGRSMLQPIQTELQSNPPLPWRFSKETINGLRTVEGAFTKAIDLLKDNECPKGLPETLSNRAIVRMLLGEDEAALGDCDEALKSLPQVDSALQTKGLILLSTGRPSDAVRCFEQVNSKEIQSLVLLPLAGAYLDSGQPTKTVSLLHRLWIDRVYLPTEPKRHIQVAELLLSAYSKLKDTPAVPEIVCDLQSLSADNPEAVMILAKQLRREGKPDEAIEQLAKARDSARGPQKDHLQLARAEICFRSRRFVDAASAYEAIIGSLEDTPIVRKLLVSHFNAGNHQRALELAQALRGGGPAITHVSEIESLILEEIGDLEGARMLLVQLARLEPDNHEHNLRLAFIHHREGEPDQARAIVSTLRLQDLRSTPRWLMNAARLRDWLGMGGVLPFAYNARRADFNNPQVHLAYITCFLVRSKEDSEQLEPLEVKEDCTVLLKRDNETVSFTITLDDEPNRARDELSPSDPLATKLLGRKAGEKVTLKEGPLELLAYTVVTVKSKYVHAFQETLEKFSTWFPDEEGFARVEMPPGDVSKILSAVDARHQFVEQLLGFYREGTLPLGALANLVGRSIVEILGDLSVSGSVRIRSSSGNPVDAKGELGTVSQADALAMDLTALFTMSVLDFLEKLPKGFERICVAQDLLDEIDESLVRDFGKLRTRTTLGKADGKYYRHEITTEQLNYRRQFLERIRDFVRSSCDILPVKAALGINRTNYENMRLLLGKGSLGSILIAKDQEIPFYSDDLSLRILARNDWRVDGVWSQTILKHLTGKGVISEEEYHRSVIKLLRGNFWFVSLELADVVWTLDEFQMLITPEVLRVFEALQGPDCDEDSAVVLVAKLLKHVWVASLVGGQRLMILDLALSSLTTGRDSRRAMTKLNSLLQGEFNYHPIALNEIQNTVSLWLQQRFRN